MLRLISFWVLLSSAFILALTVVKIVELLGMHRSGYDAQEQSLLNHQASSSVTKVLTLRICSSAASSSTLAAALERLDQTSPVDNYDAWVGTIQHAERAVLNALACAPTNGYYWARFAMIRQSQVEIAGEIKVLISLSQYYSPMELNALNVRLSLYNHLSTQTLRATGPVVALDQRVICDPRYRWSQAMLVPPGATLAERFGSHQLIGWCQG